MLETTNQNGSTSCAAGVGSWETGPCIPKGSAVWRIAEGYRSSGLSLIPICPDGSKSPDASRLPGGKWAAFQTRRPTAIEIHTWFNSNKPGSQCGIAIVGGIVSGGLEILDLDTWDLVEPFHAELQKRCPGLIDRLVRVRTPRPGQHLYYRIASEPQNQKLARKPVIEDGRRIVKTLIETKGTGGYVLAPGSPAVCHPTGRYYELLAGPGFDQIPMLSTDEHSTLIDTARSFDEIPEPVPRKPVLLPRQSTMKGDSPWADFNARATWSEILAPKGWSLVNIGPDGTEYWRRPSSTSVHSAAVHPDPPSILRVYSSNAGPLESCLEGGPVYTKFEAFKLLHCHGDLHDAVWKVKRMGYGATPERAFLPAHLRR